MKKYSLEISTILAIIILLLLTSCGTRKTDTQQHENIVIKNEYKEGEKIVLGNSFIYRPFDNSKPMILDGKKFQNAIVSNDKSIIIEKWKNRNITKTITIEKTKATIRENNDFLWIGLAFVICLFVFLWFKFPKFKMVF